MRGIVTWQVTSVVCHVSHITWQVTSVMWHVSHITRQVTSVMCHISRDKCFVSCVTYHMTGDKCCVSCVTYHVKGDKCHVPDVWQISVTWYRQHLHTWHKTDNIYRHDLIQTTFTQTSSWFIISCSLALSSGTVDLQMDFFILLLLLLPPPSPPHL